MVLPGTKALEKRSCENIGGHRLLNRRIDGPTALARILGDALAQEIPISYTQWEAWLALYHGKKLLIAKANANAPRGASYRRTDASCAAQEAHLARLRRVERYPSIEFNSPDYLVAEVYASFILDLLREALPAIQPRNLPFLSLGCLFKGRDPAGRLALVVGGRGGSLQSISIMTTSRSASV